MRATPEFRTESEMVSVLAVFMLFLQMGGNPLPAADLKAGELQAIVKDMAAKKVVDTPIRVLNAGGHNVGIGVVHRPVEYKGMSAIHNKVSEVYHMLEGSGTLVTGGTLISPEVREGAAAARLVSINGPGISGKGIQGGVSRRLTKGDIVVIPAGTPHWWSNIESPLTYSVIRVDPGQVLDLK
jgi:mannose-6-phosphate isomerase-like protein (cupin superfamily)